MAISTQAAPLAKRRSMNWVTAVSQKAFGRQLLNAFFSWISQMGGGPDLQVVEFGVLSNTDVVIADAACSIYAIFYRKTTATAVWAKAGDSATTCPTDGTGVIDLKLNTIGETVLLFPQKLTMASGFTIRCNTTATGNTTGGADSPKGMVILGS